MASLLTRAGLACALAATAVVGLHFALREAPPAAARERVEPERPPYLGLPETLPRGRTLLVYLATRARPLPARVAPVASISADGLVRLERPAPVPDGPIASDWLAAGIVLPTDDLESLSPRARAALLEVWRAFSGEGDVPLQDAAVPWGTHVDEVSLRRLLRFGR